MPPARSAHSRTAGPPAPLGLVLLAFDLLAQSFESHLVALLQSLDEPLARQLLVGALILARAAGPAAALGSELGLRAQLAGHCPSLPGTGRPGGTGEGRLRSGPLRSSDRRYAACSITPTCWRI